MGIGLMIPNVPYFQITCRVLKPPKEMSKLIDSCGTWLGLDDGIEELLFSPDPLNDSLTWINACLEDCISHHEHEPKPFSQDSGRRWLPTRLIEIDDDMNLRLVYGRDLITQLPGDAPVPRYTALSYCWGNEQDAARQLRSTTDTENLHMSGFSITQLPKVLQDAVNVTRTLSIRYIWIDALCILQDSAGDWDKESTQMAAIYGSAYLTICSLTASCHASFLDPNYRQIKVAFQSSINAEICGSYIISYNENAYAHLILVEGQASMTGSH
ncbi:heterokaryon incompatibility protein-domain-containing protein [Podospora fimiseda]|uniref:Heterokaryon incompatibility protein-domain-containing protein n=1 Tax=Podospora fimiseda TaxID=252190 RepID=A0AAN7BFQ3_9PEZI|nr:heterokaryon incompatibility protein-domain-containing protein [Podospora fimiseda]